MTDSGLTAAQCRGARAMIGISQTQLAEAATVARQTIVDFERGARIPYPNNLAAIRSALESAGVEFTGGYSPGVRLRPNTGISPSKMLEAVKAAVEPQNPYHALLDQGAKPIK